MGITSITIQEGSDPDPINWSIINGDKTTGVTIMKMDEGMDTGDIIL